MRKLAAIITASAVVAAGFSISPVSAQTRTASITPVEKQADAALLISSTIKAFPNGGQPLKAAIADLVVKNPSYASAVAAQILNDTTLSPAQKEAVVAGLSEALNKLGVVAQAGGLSPLMLALIIGGAGLAAWGIYEATKDNTTTTNNASPN